MSGILPVDKPAGWTSHDVVARVRRVAGQKAVGHAGTLDPLATGVLLIALGSATKLTSYLMESPKSYAACIVLGATTVTDDAEAPLSKQTPIEGVNREEIDACLQCFTGTIEQVPPLYAAVRHSGKKLYQLARKGIEVQPQPRTVSIHRIDMVSWEPPRLTVRIHCEAGTYIRALARDVGARLGVGAYLHALRRTSSGSFTVDACVRLDELRSREDVLAHLEAPDRALVEWPAAVLDSESVAQICQGQGVPFTEAEQGNLRVYDPEGVLTALGTIHEGTLRPFRVFSGGA